MNESVAASSFAAPQRDELQRLLGVRGRGRGAAQGVARIVHISGLMTALRRASERRHVRRRRQEAWHTFPPQGIDGPLAEGFGSIEVLDEHKLQPGAMIPFQPQPEAEIITYVREGTLSVQDAVGRPGVILAGEFQRMTAGRHLQPGPTNASRTEPAHVFQMRLHPLESGRGQCPEQRRFSVAERRGLLCVVATPDGRRGSLRIQTDAQIYSAILDPGQHVVHELLKGRGAWLHLVKGEVTLGDLVLTTGDGVGVIADRAVSLTALAESEILLLDFGGQPRNTGSRRRS